MRDCGNTPGKCAGLLFNRHPMAIEFFSGRKDNKHISGNFIQLANL